MAWEVIYNQYLQQFGLKNEEYQRWMMLKRDIHQLRLQFLVEQDRRILIFVQQKEIALEEMEKSDEKVNFDKIIPRLDRTLGLKFPIDENTIPAKRIYQYMEDLNENSTSDV